MHLSGIYECQYLLALDTYRVVSWLPFVLQPQLFEVGMLASLQGWSIQLGSIKLEVKVNISYLLSKVP